MKQRKKHKDKGGQSHHGNSGAFDSHNGNCKDCDVFEFTDNTDMDVVRRNNRRNHHHAIYARNVDTNVRRSPSPSSSSRSPTSTSLLIILIQIKSNISINVKDQVKSHMDFHHGQRMETQSQSQKEATTQ
jgi:hypothetical protein